jgi:cadmium resistance protein CadD (predicted permease)
MAEILTIIAITSGAFIGTNLDNLVLLVALYSRYEQHSTLVTAGYLSGMILIGAICLAIGELGELIPLAYLGLLGVVPIVIGVIALLHLFQGTPTDEAPSIAIDSNRNAIFVTTLTTQLSNGADSIITFSVLLADSTDVFDYLIEPVFLAMSCIFAGTAYYSLKHRRVSQFLGHYGHYVTPFILILVGIYILSNTATDLMPG